MTLISLESIHSPYRLLKPTRSGWLKIIVIGIGLCFVSVHHEPANGQDAKKSEPAETKPEEKSAAEDSEEESIIPEPLLLEEMIANYPSSNELLKNPPVDWVVLKDQLKVIIVEPILPRPGTLEKLKKEYENFPKPPPKSTAAERALHKLKRDQHNKISLFLPADKSKREFFLETYLVDHIIYHEDQLLHWVKTYGKQNKFREAFDVLYKLERRVPDWPGVQEQHDNLLLIEARYNSSQNRPEMALAILTELRKRNSDYPGLSDTTGEIIHHLVTESIGKNDYRKARHFLARLQRITTDHPVYTQWVNKLSQEATDLLNRSRQLTQQAQQQADNNQNNQSLESLRQATQSARQAAHIWPELRGLADAHRFLTERYQLLKVGVLRFSDEPTNYIFPTDDQFRISHLQTPGLFDAHNSQEVTQYSSPYLSNWTPEQLGRRLTLELRTNFQPWEPYTAVNAYDIHEQILARITPGTPEYDERISNYISTVNVHSPKRFEILYNKVPLRSEALLTFPVSNYQLNSVANNTDQGEPVFSVKREQIAPKRFDLIESGENRRLYRRATPEPHGLLQQRYHIADVEEIKYPNIESAYQGLMRGEIVMLPNVRGKWLPHLKENANYFALKKSIPLTCVLQFNLHSEPCKNRELRRAIAFATNREKILRETILESNNPELGRVISAPFPTKNQAYYSLSETRPYDLTLAFGLVTAAKKRLKDKFRPLKMICAPDTDLEKAADQMILEWQRIGLEVERVTGAEPVDKSEGWDIVLRTHRMEEPIVEIWPFLTQQPTARSEDLLHLPAWLRQELVDLENAGNLRRANELLHRLHLHLQASVQIIPLWEIDDFVVIRKNIKGISPNPVYPYQNVEQWKMASWIPVDN